MRALYWLQPDLLARQDNLLAVMRVSLTSGMGNESQREEGT